MIIFVDGFIGKCFLVSSHPLALMTMIYIHLMFSRIKIYFILSLVVFFSSLVVSYRALGTIACLSCRSRCSCSWDLQLANPIHLTLPRPLLFLTTVPCIGPCVALALSSPLTPTHDPMLPLFGSVFFHSLTLPLLYFISQSITVSGVALVPVGQCSWSLDGIFTTAK